MQQRRWVSYIYRYREFVRCEIAGFIKVQRISNKENTNGDENVQGICVYVLCVSAMAWTGEAIYSGAVRGGRTRYDPDKCGASVEQPARRWCSIS